MLFNVLCKKVYFDYITCKYMIYNILHFLRNMKSIIQFCGNIFCCIFNDLYVSLRGHAQIQKSRCICSRGHVNLSLCFRKENMFRIWSFDATDLTFRLSLNVLSIYYVGDTKYFVMCKMSFKNYLLERDVI